MADFSDEFIIQLRSYWGQGILVQVIDRYGVVGDAPRINWHILPAMPYEGLIPHLY
jgi:hypothetical protein